jgi:hypothetical protein
MDPFYRQDPGPCPICGQDHAACTTDSGPVVVPQLPARDAMPIAASGDKAAADSDSLAQGATQAAAPAPEPPPVAFTTKTYDRAKHGARR